MVERLYLHVPSFDELYYREKIMSDLATMDYNKGYELGFADYDKETGCIAFPKSKWETWFDYFINNEPERFYAYIARKKERLLLVR